MSVSVIAILRVVHIVFGTFWLGRAIGAPSAMRGPDRAETPGWTRRQTVGCACGCSATARHT